MKRQYRNIQASLFVILSSNFYRCFWHLNNKSWINYWHEMLLTFIVVMGMRRLTSFYSGRRRRVLQWAGFFFVFVFPIFHFGRWLVRGNFAVFSSHVRPVNRNKWRRAIWNAHITYKRIPPNAIFFYHAEYTNGLFIFYWQSLGRRISGFGTFVLLVKYNIDRDQKKPVSTIFIRGNPKWNHLEDSACSLSFRNIRY